MNLNSFRFPALIIVFLICQSTSKAAEYYWLFLTDKCNTSSIQLSAKAQWKKQLRGIIIDERDYAVCPDYVQQIVAFKEIKVRYVSRWLNAISVEIPSNATIPQQVLDLPFVRSYKKIVESTNPLYVNKFEEAKKSQRSSNSEINSQKYGDAFNQIAMLKLNLLHDKGFDGSNVDIAIFDSGFLGLDEHEFFQNLLNDGRIKGTFNVHEGTAEVFKNHSHGFYVAGVLASYKEGELIGSAPKANYYLFRTEVVEFELKVEEDNWLRAAEIADSLGVDIINSSLGYTEFDIQEQNYFKSDLDGVTGTVTSAANIAFEKGILVVNSAGNYREKAWVTLGKPADGINVLAVGAVNNQGLLTNFSSPGPSADGRIKPDCCAQGQDVFTASYSGGTIALNGTSFSAPLISGAAACLWQANPSLSNKSIKELIINSASNNSNPDNNCGFGIPNFNKAFQQILPVIKAVDKQYFIYFRNNDVVISRQSNQPLTVSIFDLNGRLLEKRRYSSNIAEVSLAELSSGIYFLQLQFGNKIFTEKVVRSK